MQVNCAVSGEKAGSHCWLRCWLEQQKFLFFRRASSLFGGESKQWAAEKNILGAARGLPGSSSSGGAAHVLLKVTENSGLLRARPCLACFQCLQGIPTGAIALRRAYYPTITLLAQAGTRGTPTESQGQLCLGAPSTRLSSFRRDSLLHSRDIENSALSHIESSLFGLGQGVIEVTLIQPTLFIFRYYIPRFDYGNGQIESNGVKLNGSKTVVCPYCPSRSIMIAS